MHVGRARRRRPKHDIEFDLLPEPAAVDAVQHLVALEHVGDRFIDGFIAAIPAGDRCRQTVQINLLEMGGSKLLAPAARGQRRGDERAGDPSAAGPRTGTSGFEDRRRRTLPGRHPARD